MAIRFHPLISAMSVVRSATSFSLKCSSTYAYTASGACVSAICVRLSVHARAALSRPVNRHDSIHALSK